MIVINSIPGSQIAKLTAAAGGIFQYSSLGQNASSIAGEPTTAQGYEGQSGNILLNAPGSGRLEGKPFAVRASGYITMKAGTYTSTVTLYLLGGTPTEMATPTTSYALATCAFAAYSQTSTSTFTFPFFISIEDVVGDSVSGTLTGQQYGTGGPVGGVIHSGTVIGNIPTGLVFTNPGTYTLGAPTNSTEPPLQFSVQIASATGAQISVAKLDALTLESNF